jgi:hypothetical protein
MLNPQASGGAASLPPEGAQTSLRAAVQEV